MQERPRWKWALSEPFWQSLVKLLLVSFAPAYLLTMVVSAPIRHWTTGDGEACYLVAVAITWWLLYGRRLRR